MNEVIGNNYTGLLSGPIKARRLQSRAGTPSFHSQAGARQQDATKSNSDRVPRLPFLVFQQGNQSLSFTYRGTV